ncbi:MAG: hypothetical protein OSB70_00710 [Myxococcota bacterium]|nr:hypothetical protein [Myxococcota bacterium]
MGQPTSSERTPRSRLILVFLILGAGLLFILAREDQKEPPKDEASRSPAYETPSAYEEAPDPAEGDEEPAGERGAKSRPESDEARPLAGQAEPATGAAPGSDIDAEAADEAARIDRAIRRALLMQELEQGIEAARANPSLPPAALAGIQRNANKPVPIEVQQGVERVVTIPPEILKAMEPRETPDEIKQALKEAQERGTSEALRLYMAGEGPPPPGWQN